MFSFYGVSRVANSFGGSIMELVSRIRTSISSRGVGLLPFALLGFLMYSMSFAQFTGTELDASEAVVTGLLAAGAVAVIAFAIYGIGKRASNKV